MCKIYERVVRKWSRCLDACGKVGTILMDLSEACDCLPHDLLNAKSAAYGLGINSLCLMYSYLGAKKSKIGVAQGSMLGPLFFNIFINDLCSIKPASEICNFVDNNTLYSCGHDLQEIVINLEIDFSRLLVWFKSNGMVVNPKNFRLCSLM